MISLEDLLGKVKNTSKKHETLIIGIDGYGGSGKTTVAKFLKENLRDCIIVEMDDFYSPILKRADFNRVKEQVLDPLVIDKPASYQVYDWKSDSLGVFQNINPGGVVIIEGVYSIHKDIASSYDIKIWVDCLPEVGAKRGIERDMLRDGVDNSDKWLNIWMLEEKKYVESQNPKASADYIIDGLSLEK